MNHSTSYFKWLCMLLMVAFSTLQAKAQDPYVEDFSSTAGSSYAVTALPEGWACKGTLGSFEKESDKYHNGKPGIAIHPNTSNYLITPKLAAGPIGFWLRQYTKTYAASAKVYYCTESNGEFTIGSQIGSEATLPKNATTWTSFSYTLESDSRVAILFDGVFDDFVAVNGIVEETGGNDNPDNPGGESGGEEENPGMLMEKHLQITAFTRNGDFETNADANNKFSASFNVKVKNTGTMTLNANEVSVSITDKYTEGYKVLATATATKSLAANEEVTIPVEVTNVDGGTGGYVYFYAKENLENTFFKSSYGTIQNAYIYVNPYVAKFAIYEAGGSSSLSSYYSLDFGKVSAITSKSFEIRNAGAAPLEVSSISVPEGFTVDPSSFTVAGGDKQTFTISLVPVADNYGDYSGNVVITHSLGTYSFPVKGTTIDPDNIVVDFNGGVFPSNWVKSSNFTASTYGGGIGYVSSTSSKGYIQSPRITIKEGKKLSFKAEKYSTSGTAHLTLSYSANGKDWTEIKDYGSEMTGSFQTFVVDEIPAGKWYIKFEGTYFDIDDITGFGYCTEPLVDLTISAVGYSTFAPQYDVEIPEGIKVYIVENLPENDAVKLTPVTGTIAKGEGVIVKGEPNAIVIFDTVEAAEKHEGNLLVGTTRATELEEESAYILYASEGKAVFSLCSAGTIAAGKSYLPATGATAAPTLKFVFDDATSVHTAVEVVKTNDAYNIAGQKVASDYKGIVIKNGKKYLMK